MFPFKRRRSKRRKPTAFDLDSTLENGRARARKAGEREPRVSKLVPKTDLISGDVVRMAGKVYVTGPNGNLVRVDKKVPRP